MQADDAETIGTRRGAATLRRRWAIRLLSLASTLALMTGVGGVFAGSASANSYTGLLYGGNLTITAGTQNEGGGFVYGDDSWTAPSGTSFGGFAYTYGAFQSLTSDSVGAISAGFGGDGSANQPSLLFPWTSDCAVSNVGHYWAYSNGSTVAGTTGNSNCTTGGSTGGWNFNNSEIYNTSPGTNPQTGYSTLWASVYCQAGTCKYTGNATNAAYLSVDNLSGDFDDPYNTPSGGISWNGLSGSWVQTNTGNVSLSASASDPAGVCSMHASLSGPESLGATLGNQNPGVANVGAEIGTEFSSGTDPCWVGQTDSGSWTLPGGLPSGSYAASLQASNPGNYQGQGFSSSGSPTVASTGSVSIDDQTPTVDLMSPTGSTGWTSSHTATVDISTGPSGLSSLACTDNGAGDGATLKSSGGDSYVYTVALSGGSNAIACSASNNDGNGALTGRSGTQVYQQDSTVPSISFTDVGYTAGTWSSSQQSIQVTASGGASGISGLSCTLDGNTLPDGSGDTDTVGAAGPSQTAFVTVAANGAHTLACTADNAGTPSIVGAGSYQVDVDSQIPQATFLSGSGYAATSTHATDPQTASGQNWLSGSSTITVGLAGTEPTVESGVETITCTINGYVSHAITLTNVPTSGSIAQNTPFQATFTADPRNGWIDGQNAVACSSTTVAGVTGADGASAGTSSVEYVDVNDASWPTTPGSNSHIPTPGDCGISSVIDNGGCAYSDGPSQTAWYSTSQTVRIEADDTGAAAPITSITCSGVAMPVSSWTASADPQDIDAHNGLTVVATIQAPGGKLDCSASDSASPADTYELGTYNASIDPSTPSGYFEAQGYENAADNIIELKLKDNPSGIKQVAVQATDSNTGVLYTGDQLTTNPADGHTAYATLDQNTGTWNLTVNPGVFPNVDDKIKFVATATTNAGVTGAITTAENGASEVVTPRALGDNPTQLTGYSQTGDATAITATARTGHWTAAGTSEQQLPTALQGTSSNPIAATLVGTIASWKHSVCKAATKKHGKRANSEPERKCSLRKVMSRAPRSEALPAKYGQETEITGKLMDTQTNTPLAGGSVGIYTTNLVTDQVKLVHIETAGARGNFSYRLAAGPDRRVDLIYLGQWDRYHGADTAFDTTTAGRVRAHAAGAVRVGQHMWISGRILGGSIQTKGAIVQTEYEIVGQKRGWAPFKPGRSTVNGSFVIRFPVARGSAGLNYRIRIKVPTQSGWGFRGAASNVLRFRVN